MLCWPLRGFVARPRSAVRPSGSGYMSTIYAPERRRRLERGGKKLAVQETYSREVGEHEGIAITLECLRCKSLRTFIITENLRLLLAKEWSALRIGTECPACRVSR